MLKTSSAFACVQGPVVTVVMDGIGQRAATLGNAVANAYTPTLKRLLAQRPNVLLRAHGTAVGMPSDDDMGNSEVGHNALGSGQIYEQGAALVNAAIANGSLFSGAAWREVATNAARQGSTLHLLGLLSDGNVHSHLDHVRALISGART
jgi:2,3-bisphosphoglycerate-independent phosphoglycerate mutase